MLANIGTSDRIIRIVLGFALVAWFATTRVGFWPWAALVVGLVLLATAAINFCPLYRIFGMSTRAKQ